MSGDFHVESRGGMGPCVEARGSAWSQRGLQGRGPRGHLEWLPWQSLQSDQGAQTWGPQKAAPRMCWVGMFSGQWAAVCTPASASQWLVPLHQVAASLK